MPKTTKSNTATAVATAPPPVRNVTPKNTVTPPEIKTAATTGNPVRKSKPLEPASDRSPAKEAQEITLKYTSSTARKVNVAGNFNAWHPDSTPLKNNGSGEWTVRLALRSGQYEYRFVVDGHWVEDPHAAHRGPNSFGGFNSILTVPATART